MKIPQLKKKPELKSCHNVTWEDDYSWIHQENILEVLNSPYVDIINTYSNDIHEMNNTFGIEAARELLIEQMEDLIHDCEGVDAYSGFGTTMEDDGFYDTPDFTKLVVD